MATKVEKAKCILWFTESKSIVYVPPLPRTLQELKTRIQAAVEAVKVDTLDKAIQELEFHLQVCSVINGSHIENFTLTQT
jgi:uncharacterized protein YybS (DUF2232 family)